MKKIIVLLALFTVSFSGHSVCVEMNKERVKKAEKLFDQSYYRKALPYLKELLSNCPESVDYKLMAGICYLHTPYKNEAVKCLEEAKKMDRRNYYPDISYYLGRAYHTVHRFDDAIIQYKSFMRFVDPEAEPDLYDQCTFFITNCQTGQKLQEEAPAVTMVKLGAPLNTPFSENCPVISPEGDRLFFTSRRNTCTGGTLDPYTDDYTEDIFVAELEGEKIASVKKLDSLINSPFNEAPVAISSDGSRLFYYGSDENFISDLYYTVIKDESFTSGAYMGNSINQRNEFETGGCLSPDGTRFYFSSSRPGGYGGMDIYVSEIGEDGSWGPAVNLGEEVNSAYDEEAPFLNAEDSRLYFSSNGKNSIGGFDIFCSEMNEGKFTRPKNLGFPVNSADDEIYITFTSDEKKAVISKTTTDNYGLEDIYMVYFESQDKSDVPVVADLPEMKREEKSEEDIVVKENNKVTGDLQVTDEYLYKFIPHFMTNNSSYITDYSKEKLDRLAEVLLENPEIKLQLTGYADQRGAETLNKKLSLERAGTIKKYLCSKGIAEDRLNIDGKGEKEPVYNGKLSTKLVLNRRVEFRILK